jgi:hypothetical protein
MMASTMTARMSIDVGLSTAPMASMGWNGRYREDWSLNVRYSRILTECLGHFVESSIILGIGCTYRQHLIDERICPDSRVPVPIIK